MDIYFRELELERNNRIFYIYLKLKLALFLVILVWEITILQVGLLYYLVIIGLGFLPGLIFLILAKRNEALIQILKKFESYLLIFFLCFMVFFFEGARYVTFFLLLVIPLVALLFDEPLYSSLIAMGLGIALMLLSALPAVDDFLNRLNFFPNTTVQAIPDPALCVLLGATYLAVVFFTIRVRTIRLNYRKLLDEKNTVMHESIHQKRTKLIGFSQELQTPLMVANLYLADFLEENQVHLSMDGREQLAVVKHQLDKLKSDISTYINPEKREPDAIQEPVVPSVTSQTADPQALHAFSKDSLELEEYNEQKFNLLIVDSSLELLVYLKKRLKEKYNLYFALNSQEAFKKMEFIPLPNLIIAELISEEGNNFVFLDALASNIQFKSIPFIFLTASPALEDEYAALAKGAVDYIVKPLIIEKLLLKIEAHINLQVAREKVLLENVTQLYKILVNRGGGSMVKAPLHSVISAQYGLTTKESEVLGLIIKGKTTKEICQFMHISSESTIKSRINEIFKKFGVKSRVELLALIYSQSKL